MAGLTVACVLRSGGPYDARHVAGLHRQVAFWMPDARFVCLSDVPVECERVPLMSDWPGWWSKIELFRHFKERTLYLDLDSVIVADPMPIVTGEFLMVRNWVLPDLMTSCVMSWCGDYSHITDEFATVSGDVIERYVTCEQWGDQAYIAERAGDVQTFPDGAVCSWRLQLRTTGRTTPPRGTKIVAFNQDDPPWSGPSWARCWWHAAKVGS